MTERNVRQAIMGCAAALVERRGWDHVTVRDIAAAAGVGVGLINYHFGSKDELLRQCAQAAVAEELSRFRASAEGLAGLPALERLRVMLKRTADYMAAHPEMNRLSLLTDLRQGDYEGDNMDQSMAEFLPLVAAAGGTGTDTAAAQLRTHILIHAIQAAMLRSASVKARIGLDFFDKADRDRFVDLTVDQLFRKEPEQ